MGVKKIKMLKVNRLFIFFSNRTLKISIRKPSETNND